MNEINRLRSVNKVITLGGKPVVSEFAKNYTSMSPKFTTMTKTASINSI